MDIAIAVDRLQTATTLEVRRLAARWAGLRSFVADRTIVCGFDAAASGFFWLAAQGGYGIQTSAAMSRVAGGLAIGRASCRERECQFVYSAVGTRSIKKQK